MGVADKKRRYGKAVRSLVFESGGRMADASAGLLVDLAQEARSFGARRLGRGRGFEGRALRLALEACIIRQSADDILLALGLTSANTLTRAVALWGCSAV